MIQRYQRSGLRHSVALDQGESGRGPEDLQIGRQSSAARHERPEFKSQTPMNGTEAPPTFTNRLTPGGSQALRQFGKLAHQPGAEQIEYPGNSRQNGNALPVHKLRQAWRLQPVFKMDFRDQQRGYPQTHELTKHMAERQRMQNAQGVNQALVAQV